MRSRVETSQEEINAIIRKCQVCHVAMVDSEGKPYVIPMNFGYEDGTIYFHSSGKGKKIDLMRLHPSLCVAFNTDHHLRFQSEEVACSYSMKYRSVLAYGKAVFVEDPEMKKEALDVIMKNYSPREFSFNPPSVKEVCCWVMKVEKFECRIYGY